PLGVSAKTTALKKCEKFPVLSLKEIMRKGRTLSSSPSIFELLEINKSQSGKSLVTKNKMGFDIVSNGQSNWVIDELNRYLLSLKKPTVLDVGGGFGGLSKRMLDAGA